MFRLPSVRCDSGSDDEVKDPQAILREKCKKTDKAKKLYEILEECTNRVNSKNFTTETCTPELFDFLSEVDHCVSKTLFQKLK